MKTIETLIRCTLLSFLTILSFLHTNLVFSQEGLIRNSPFTRNSNQYMVINPGQIPNATDFKLKIYKKTATYQPNEDTTYHFNEEWEGEFNASDPYLKIPETYTNKENILYKYVIFSYSERGGLISETPVFEDYTASLSEPEHPAYINCSVDCNGPDYAYSIHRFENDPVNSTKYKLEMAPATTQTDFEVEVKYYQYMGNTQFQAWSAAQQAQGVSWQYKVLNYESSVLPPGDYYNSQNSLITDMPVYAIEKDLGPWQPDGTIGMDYISLPLYPLSNQSNWKLNSHVLGCDQNTLSAQIAQINNDYDIQQYFINYDIENVGCLRVQNNGKHGSGGSGPSFSEESANITYFVNCYLNLVENTGNDFGVPWNWSSISYYSCTEVNPSPYSLIDSIHAVKYERIKDVYNPRKNTILFPEEIVNNNVFYGYDYSLDSGLYKITFVYKDLTVVDFLAYHENFTTYSMKQADVFDAIVYPNPIIDKEYNIKMNSEFDLGTIQYEVYSPQNGLLYSEQIQGVFEDGEKIHFVSTDENINFPYIIHLFTFSDGSTYSVTTLIQ